MRVKRTLGALVTIDFKSSPLPVHIALHTVKLKSDLVALRTLEDFDSLTDHVGVVLFIERTNANDVSSAENDLVPEDVDHLSTSRQR